MPVFQPPTVEDIPPIYAAPDLYAPVPALSQRLFRHYKLRTRGRSVLKSVAGTYSIVDTPSQDQIDAAAVAYLGGHVYVVDVTEADALEGAGFDVARLSQYPFDGRYPNPPGNYPAETI